MLVCCFVVCMPVLLQHIFKRGMTRIYVVGNGISSNVVIRGQGKTVVVNCGGGFYAGRKLIDFLDSKGISKVDILVLASREKRHVLGAVEFLRAMPPTCVVLSKGAQKSNIIDYVDLDRSRVILNEKFYLEYLPISINVLNKGKDFGFYLNVNGACFAYSKTLDFMNEMSKKRHINFAILDEKVKSLKDLKFLDYGCCLGLLNGDVSSKFFKSASNKRITEFLVEKHFLKRGEI